MKQTKKARVLSPQQFREIREWLKKAWKSGGSTAVSSDCDDLLLHGRPNAQYFGRYAHSSTSSETIAAAASFISLMESRLVRFDNNTEVKISSRVHEAVFEKLQNRIASNDHPFFECVAIMLRHRQEKKTPVAQMDWRSIKKHAPSRSKPLPKMTLPSAMEFAAFHVLRKRVPLAFLGDDPNKCCNTAVTREELRKALRLTLRAHGHPNPGRVTDPQLSLLLHTTAAGQFLIPLMQEKPIMKAAQKVQRTRNRED